MAKTPHVSRRMMLGTALAAAAASSAVAATPKTETIAIIGTGNVGTALGKRWGALGHTIVYGSRTPESEKIKLLVKSSGKKASAVTQKDAGKTATIIVMAVPAAAGIEALKALGDISGKIVIDAMNEMTFQDGKLIEPTEPEALAARLQAAAPGAFVVKALNVTSSRAMTDPAVTGGPVVVPIAGGNAEAKLRVTALLKALGLEVFDMGGADAYKHVEHLGRIYVAYGATHRPQRLEFGFRTWAPPQGR
ncbi:MAG: NAD(P)-binding domain-containing protein [Rhodospirillaceae bacterium]|nr:NAD(P)-binding domain-containing protein [Rhodospirillaceae bacterium]